MTLLCPQCFEELNHGHICGQAREQWNHERKADHRCTCDTCYAAYRRPRT